MSRRKKIIRFVILSAIAIVIFILIRTYIKKDVFYYKNGQLEHEVLLINGKYQRLRTDFFENGSVRAKSYWRHGTMDGINTIYYEDGSTHQEKIYRSGVLLSSRDFAADGTLHEVRLYDSLKRIIDYFIYKADGTRDFSGGNKDPIFIPNLDTLIFGKSYRTEIRLGNRQHDNIEVVMGNIEDMQIAKKNPPLPKKNNLTSVLNIQTDSLGVNEISGIVIERSSTSDSIDVTPFKHRFFVKEN